MNPSDTSDLADIVVAAVHEPSDERVAALRHVLAGDIRAAGPFVNGSDADTVVASIRTPAIPALQMADFGPPTAGEYANEILVRGVLPAGHQICAVILVLRHRGDRLVELLQEVELAAPPPAVAVHLDETIAAAIDNAFAAGHPIVVTYVDAELRPHASFRGTVQTFSADALALWIRDPKGGLLRAIEINPNVALLYRDPTSRTQYEITGRASRRDDPVVRRQVFDKSAPFEQGLDPAMRGAAVVIDIDIVLGGAPGRPVHLRRDPT